MKETSTPIKEPSKAFIKALHHLLRPLVRLLLHFQITYPSLGNILKQLYVDVAERDFKLEGKAQTDSRISLLTGIHRKDVKRLREVSEEAYVPSATASLGSQIIARWLSDPAYLNAEGLPIALPKSGDKGLSFDQLVKEVAKQDIRSRAVLDEWVRLGVAKMDDKDHVVLNNDAFVPKHGFDDKAFFFGKHLHDHISASAHNLTNGEPPQFDRGVFYNNLTTESIETLRELIEVQATALLVSVNKEAKALQIDDRGKEGANQRFNLGAYFWVEEQAPKKDVEGKKEADDEK
ncbi:hypothetical protein OLMES_3406 [Oleiphilus messinensis]|uniref:Uncharacterized protein n=2 Tax=Oleiphilus messinensis TaxID=141451 RepID=A0A1Y0IDJ4_9GAMM|nr:hypothetical protein OLMES_3406 [Oleiphilus messinensis]